MRIHRMLINIGARYAANPNGVCNGITLRWIEARLSGTDEIFTKRMKYILSNYDSLEKIYSSKLFPTDPTQQEILAFLESIVIFQTPSKYRDVLAARKVKQSQVETTSLIASSDKILELGGLCEAANHLRIFTEFELAEYLDEIAELLESIEPKISGPVTIVMSNLVHAMGLSYEVGKGWQYMDINSYSPVDKPYKKTDIIAAKIFNDNHIDYSPYLNLNMQFISTKFNPNLPILKDRLSMFQEQYKVTSEIARRTDEVSLLFMAADRGDLSLTKKLLAKGADVNSTDKNGCTPLSLACESGHLEIVKLLLADKRIDLNKKGLYGASPLWWAANNGHTEIVKLLLERNAKVANRGYSGLSTLGAACLSDNFEVVKLLVAKKADVNSLNKDKESPLLLACYKSQPEMVELLLASGAKVNQKDKSKQSPLLIACTYGNLEIVKMLLAQGARINDLDKSGRSPLYLAAKYGHLDIVKLLVSHQANIHSSVKTTDKKLRKLADGSSKMQARVNEFLKNETYPTSISLTPKDIAKLMGREPVVDFFQELESQTKANKTYQTSHSFFKPGLDNNSKALLELESYLNKRQRKWNFHYNFLGMVAFVYFIQDKILKTDYRHSKSREIKIIAAEKLKGLLLGEPDIWLDAAELAACKDGELSQIIAKTKLNLDEHSFEHQLDARKNKA